LDIEANGSPERSFGQADSIKYHEQPAWIQRSAEVIADGSDTNDPLTSVSG